MSITIFIDYTISKEISENSENLKNSEILESSNTLFLWEISSFHINENICKHKKKSLDFDNCSFFIDLNDNYSNINSNSNIDFSNINPMNEDVNISFVSNIDNEDIYLFKENENNSTQKIEKLEDEEVVEKIEENNKIENESECLLNNIESQRNLAIYINNEYNESKDFSQLFNYGSQTCNRIMKGTEHCTEYSYPHYIEIIEKNDEYYYEQIQFSFKLNVPKIENSNEKNHLINESLLLDLSKEEVNNISFLSFYNSEEENLISEKEINKQIENNNNKGKDNNLADSYNKILRISNKEGNNATIQIIKSKNKINMNEQFQKDKTIIKKMVNVLEVSYSNRGIDWIKKKKEINNNFENKQKICKSFNIQKKSILLLKEHIRDDIQDDYEKKEEKEEGDLFIWDDKQVDYENEEKGNLSVVDDIQDDYEKEEDEEEADFFIDNDKNLEKDNLLKILNHIYYYNKKNNNFFIKKKIMKKLLFSILKDKKKISNCTKINDFNILNELNFNSKIVYKLSDIYKDFNRKLLKRVFPLFFYREKYLENLKKKFNKLKNFLLHSEKAKFILLNYLLKIVKKTERLKYLLNYF